MGTRL